MVILSEVNFSVHKGIREVPYIRVDGYAFVLLVGDLVDFIFDLWDFAVYPLYGFVKQLGQGYILINANNLR